MSWVLVAAGVGTAVGGAVSYMGAKKNAKAIDDANAANAEQADKATAYNYRMWLEKQGVDANGGVINTKLPRWLGVKRVGGASSPYQATTLKVNSDGTVGDTPAAPVTAAGTSHWSNPGNAGQFLNRGRV